MIKILYLEDDINLSDTICEFLEENNFYVVASYTSSDALKQLYNTNFDVLLLDVNLPDMSGFELLKSLRDASIITPAIFITTLDDIDSLDKGYSVGVDDYIRKPFALKELLHRINSLIKREFKIQDKTIQISRNILFDINASQLYKDNIVIKLNQKELSLLKLLLQNINQVVSLDAIYEKVWTSSQTNSEASLRTYIKNLRKIIGKEKIVNIKKQGYKLIV